MSGHPPPTTRHLARVKPGKAPSAWRPVLALCGRKVPADRIVQPWWKPDPGTPGELCEQCAESVRRREITQIVEAAGRYRIVKAALT